MATFKKLEESSVPASPTRFVDSSASVLFDLFRGLAALLVFLEHGRNLLFVDYPDLVSHRLLLAVPYVLCGAGHQAVVVFFVLSGYFISGAVFSAVRRNQWLWSDYLVRRLVRLWVVLVPALLFCALWDKWGIYLGHAPELYRGAVQNHMLRDVGQSLTPGIFFGNLFFLQSIFVDTFGSDSALWSLANEFWYYILFPLGFFALRRSTRLAHRLLYGLLFVGTAWLVRGGILFGFPIWLAGTLLLFVLPPRFDPRRARLLRVVSTPVYLLLLFFLAKVHGIPGLVSDYLLTVATFAFLWILQSANHRSDPKSPFVRFSRELARFSYTLYAVHIPLLVFMASLTIGDTRWIPTPAHILAGLGLGLVTLFYAFALASFTEFRTDAVRRRIEKLLRLPSPRSSLPSNPNMTPSP
ncbi:MAG: hypothetical protein JWM43_1714 [Acidobacteriaceae bacterium]|nr:hypothetical protein [Acidobacteriaceae bacterium]